jgi:hypothetical protein
MKARAKLADVLGAVTRNDYAHCLHEEHRRKKNLDY